MCGIDELREKMLKSFGVVAGDNDMLVLQEFDGS